MSFRSRLPLIVGVVLGLVGLAVAFVPNLAPNIRVTSAGVAAIALLALALAGALAVAHYRDSRQTLALPMPEGRANRVPGNEIDRQIASLSPSNPHTDEPSETYEALQARLERVAQWVLTRDGLGAEQAHEQLTGGTWTDDSHAATFLADAPEQPSMRGHLHALRTGEPPVARRARHTTGVLTRRFTRRSSTASSGDTGRRSSEDEQSMSVQPLPSEARESGFASQSRTDETTDASEGTLRLPEVGETIERRTARWRGATAVALIVGATGIVLRRPALLLASVVAVGLAAYSRAGTPPAVALDIERTVSNTHPAVGDDVEVTVTIRNGGDSFCPDCTVIDGVPPDLVVTDGSPRHGVALRSGKATTFSYTLAAVRGEHRFTPASVIVRDVSGSGERLSHIAPSNVTTITCVPQLPPLADVPLRAHAERFGGRTATDMAGSGVEFHATREYQHGDPLARIDWNRLAKTGTLSTLQFRAERTPTVVVVIDARNDAFLAPDSDKRSAVDRSIKAADRIVTTLLDETTPVGIGALSSYPERCWLAPETGDTHRERTRRLLTTHPALAAPSGDSSGVPNTAPHTASTAPTETGPENEDRALGAWLRRRLPADAQVVVLTPLCDDEIADWIRRLDVSGHAATVISPDPTVPTSPGRQLARIERAMRISDLRSAGIPVLDWSRTNDESLSVAIENLRARGEPHATRRGADTGWATR
jgi:uncharacterized repeat protein (TIGR01451 family)